jgi:hypothetical protein
MGIDRIGKSGGVPPPAPPRGADSASRPEGAGHSFEVSKSSAAAPAAGVDATTALERLRLGQIDLQGYLDAKVDEATSHLAGLPAGELSSIRAALRERLATDPALVELVRQATGQLSGQVTGDVSGGKPGPTDG